MAGWGWGWAVDAQSTFAPSASLSRWEDTGAGCPCRAPPPFPPPSSQFMRRGECMPGAATGCSTASFGILRRISPARCRWCRHGDRASVCDIRSPPPPTGTSSRRPASRALRPQSHTSQPLSPGRLLAPAACPAAPRVQAASLGPVPAPVTSACVSPPTRGPARSALMGGAARMHTLLRPLRNAAPPHLRQSCHRGASAATARPLRWCMQSLRPQRPLPRPPPPPPLHPRAPTPTHSHPPPRPSATWGHRGSPSTSALAARPGRRVQPAVRRPGVQVAACGASVRVCAVAERVHCMRVWPSPSSCVHGEGVSQIVAIMAKHNFDQSAVRVRVDA
jgi:hypothetical protein